MKFEKKFIPSIIAAVILVACFFTALFAKNYDEGSISVAFYNLSDKEKLALTSSIDFLNQERETPFTITYTECKSYDELIKNSKPQADFIFTGTGLQAENLSSSLAPKIQKKAFFAEEAISAFSSSVKGKAKKNADGKITVLPLASDLLEIDIDRTMLSATGIETINSWDDIENFAYRAKQFSPNPIVFAGRDDETLINIVGALTESLASNRQVLQAANELLLVDDEAPNLEQSYYQTVLALSEDPSAPLYAATHTLSRWIKTGLISQDTLNMTITDVYNFMDFKTAGVALVSLTEHRQIPYEDINRFVSIYYPSQNPPEARNFSSRTVAVIACTTYSSKLDFIEQLSQRRIQEKLAKESGLAPADASCQPADKQADDVRYWIAATNVPNTPLADSVCSTQRAKQALASALRSYILGL